jgi:hypothetical protein
MRMNASSSSEDSQSRELFEETEGTYFGSSSLGNNDDEAQIDPRYVAPSTERKNDRTNGTKTSILFVLFEYCLEEGILGLKFSDQLSTIWRLDKFANASFHSHFRISVLHWREKIREDKNLRFRLIKQHKKELLRLTYPLPKKPGILPIRKRGYSDKGSTRPNHQRFRSDKDTTIVEYYQDLQVVQKVVVYGRRPTVTYRRLPYSEEIGRALRLGLLRREGDFIVPNLITED